MSTETTTSLFTYNITSSTTPSDNGDNESGSSNVWIAGVVVGILIFLCLICNRRNPPQRQGQGPPNQQQQAPQAQQQQQQQNTENASTQAATAGPSCSSRNSTSSAVASNTPSTSKGVHPQKHDSLHRSRSDGASTSFSFPTHVSNSEDLSQEHSGHVSLDVDGASYNTGTLPSAPPPSAPPPAALSASTRVPEMAPPSYAEAMNMKY